MKKTISLLLVLTLLLSLFTGAAHAASPELLFDLSCEGSTLTGGVNKIAKVDTDTELTVSFRIKATDSVAIGTAQNYIRYDPLFFELVEASATAEQNFDVREASSGGSILYSTMKGASFGTSATQIGTFKLKVIGDAGQSTVSSTRAAVYGTRYEEYTVATQDLCVRVTDNFKVTFLCDGEIAEEKTVREGGNVTLPAAPAKQYYNFLYWQRDDEDTHYMPGERYTPQNNTTFTAVFEKVPAPARPEGLVGVRTTAPDIADGKITGTTAKMEYSTDTYFSKPSNCKENETTGLAAGTYYVRLKATDKIPAGEYAAVGVAAGQVPDAPMGLRGVKTSQPGARDGKITGTTSEMEWSVSADFSAKNACTGNEIKDLAAGTYYVRYRADTEKRIAAGKYAAVSVPEGQIPPAPLGLVGVTTSASGAHDGKITGTTTKMEWSKTPDFAEPHGCTGTQIDGLYAGVYYVRLCEDVYTNTCAGYAAVIVVPDGGLRAAPAGLKGVATSARGAKDGAITGTTARMEYSTTAVFTKPYDCGDGKTGGLAAGTYFVRYKMDVVSGALASNAVAVTVPSGGSSVSETASFPDVAADSYCADAVAWAVENGITNGLSDGTFGPGRSCTRAQVVTFLWRAANSPKPKAAQSPFSDVSAGAYYGDAVRWAVENGVTNGLSADRFGTDKTVTRAQFVTFLFRSRKGETASGSLPFADVSAGAYYADAVRWAVKNGVTTGLSADAFGPNGTCNRGQVVTFLYRCFAK